MLLSELNSSNLRERLAKGLINISKNDDKYRSIISNYIKYDKISERDVMELLDFINKSDIYQLRLMIRKISKEANDFVEYIMTRGAYVSDDDCKKLVNDPKMAILLIGLLRKL